MPTKLHQAFISLFRIRIDLALRLASVAGVPLSEGNVAKWREVPNDFGDPGGRGREFRSDLVLAAFEDPPPPDAPREVVMNLPAIEAMFIESQLRRDSRKYRSLSVYRAGVHCRHDCPNWGMLVSPDQGVIEWVDTRLFEREPELRPRRIGPGDVEVILDLEQARIDPGWTALTAALHARGPHALAAAKIAVRAAIGLPIEERQCYRTLVLEGLEETKMNEVMQEVPDYDDPETVPEFVRTSGFFLWGMKEARRADLLSVLDERHLDPTDQQRAVIEGCNDRERLLRWLLAALRVESVDELLAIE